jgi:hypothetical protein
MPIIPISWTGQQTVNAINSGGGGFPVYKFVKSLSITITELDAFIDLIGTCTESINREISIDISGRCKLYWKNLNEDYSQIQKNELNFGAKFIDLTLGQLGLAIKVSEPTELFIVIRWDNDIEYNIIQPTLTGDELMIPVKVRLAVGTGDNYIDINEGSYDSSDYQYLINLQKLKNSDSGVTGYKLFDITTFYPGQSIIFSVVIPDNTNYDLTKPLAIQLFDPLSVGEVMFAIANDVINLELNNIGEKFVGNLTRNAWYKQVTNNTVEIFPDYSKHIGRIIATNKNTQQFDTAIIQSYTPNTDPLLGGTFILTGDF